MAVFTVAAFEFISLVRGHHVYCDVWTPVVNEVLNLRREPGNLFSMFAIAVTKDGEALGHVPKAIERVFSLLLAREGNGGSCPVP